ncbi:MAG: endonuclease MutS2 [Phycisphaerae bacterium]
MDSFTLNKIEFDAVRCLLGEYCACSLGRSLAARITPSRTPEIIERWQEQTAQMVDVVRDVGLPPYGGITDIRVLLARTKPGGGATGEDFAEIASTLEGVDNVRDFLFALDERFDALHALAHQLQSFEGEVKAIRDVVGPDGEVLDTASPRLAELRREADEIDRRIHEVVHSYVRNPDVAKLLSNVNVTLHGDRYVLPVRSDNRGRLPGVVHRSSNTGATVFVEPNACVQFNNRLADVREDERREIQRLLGELCIRVQKRVKEMADTLRVLAQIDLLQAKAQYAYQCDMVRPVLAERTPLQFRQARHPLLIHQAMQQARAGVPEQKRHSVVPIDVRLGQDFDILVITGSNTGGKTVALKTVALLAVMAQSGMHIPADRGATLPVFRDVFIDVGDEQSLQQSLSTFGAHLKRMKYILRKIGPSSLVLLDELGAGTDPDEGGAMGQAVLDELRRVGCLAMVTTHLSVLKAYAFNHDRVDNASVEFDTSTLSPTYKLLIGTPGESHAITVARRTGLPRRVTAAATQYIARQGKQFSRAIRATQEVRQSAEQARAEAHDAKLAAESQQEVYERKLADLHRLQEEFNHWLASLPELRPGDEVYVPSLKKPGRLVRLELHRQVAVVDADGLTVEVPLRELMPDFGQQEVRRQIAELRQQILDEAGRAEAARAEAERVRQEYHRSLEMQKQRARQFDTWLSQIARVKVGDTVPIALKPGKGTVKEIDLPGLRAVVEAGGEEKTLSIQDLFPQTGPFAPRSRVQKGTGKGKGKARRPAKADGRKEPEPDRPIPRRSPESRKARKNVAKVKQFEPGQQVFVVPFNRRATLIRLDEEKDQAVVQSGIFEVEIPLADLEPVRN